MCNCFHKNEKPTDTCLEMAWLSCWFHTILNNVCSEVHKPLRCVDRIPDEKGTKINYNAIIPLYTVVVKGCFYIFCVFVVVFLN